MQLTAAKIAGYLNAGYTHYAIYEIYRELSECWVDSGFPIAAPEGGSPSLMTGEIVDILPEYQERLNYRTATGEIRYARIIKL